MSINDWFERRRLVRKGRACDKTRLRAPRSTLQGQLESSAIARWIIPAVFLALLILGVMWGHPAQRREHVTLAVMVFIGGLMLLELDCPEIWRSNSKLLLVLGASWFNLAVIKGIFVDAPPHNEAAMSQMFFLCPYTFAPFLVTLLLGTRAGLFCVLQVSILASILIPTFNFPGQIPMMDRNFTFLLVSLLSGFTAVYFSRNVRNRSDLIRAGFAVGALNLLCAVALGLVAGKDWMQLGWQALYGIGVGFSTALFVSAILPKYGLKRRMIDAIQQHHADSLVSYFHQRALQQQEDARAGGKIMNMREEDVPDVSEESFRYPGPRPQSKEVALLSLADAVEASSRSLEKPTPQRIEDMVNEIVEHKLVDHQFDESHLTMNELRAAAEAMAQTVKNMMHSRIAYAKKDKSSASKHIQPAARGAGSGPASSVAA